jgi:hypothetical protein
VAAVAAVAVAVDRRPMELAAALEEALVAP